MKNNNNGARLQENTSGVKWKAFPNSTSLYINFFLSIAFYDPDKEMMNFHGKNPKKKSFEN